MYSFITKSGLNSCPEEKEGVTFSQVDFSEEVMLKIISFKTRGMKKRNTSEDRREICRKDV